MAIGKTGPNNTSDVLFGPKVGVFLFISSFTHSNYFFLFI